MAAWFDTAVIAAMPEEVAMLERRLDAPYRIPSPPCARALSGMLFGRRTAVLVSGEGELAARTAVRALLNRFDVRRVVIIGLAGAITSDLRSGALVLAKRVVAKNGGVLFPSADLYARARAELDAVEVTAVETDVLLDASAKVGLRDRLPRGISAVADMESAAQARLVSRAGIPWLVIRAISDEAHESLPPYLARCRRVDGSFDRLSIVRGALFRPQVWPTLWRLRGRVRACARCLADAVESIERLDP